MLEHVRFTMQSEFILQQIADGCSFAEILRESGGITRHDIAIAAGEALRFIIVAKAIDSTRPGYHERLAATREQHPKAYAPWTKPDEEILVAMCRQGRTVNEMAARLQRRPNAIRSRIDKLGLTTQARTS